MGRVIQPDGVGKERGRLVKAVALALRELARQEGLTSETRDLAAFITLALDAIQATIEPSVSAWEKRGYWIKADRFRLEWQWTGDLSRRLRSALVTEDWGTAALLTAQIAQKIGPVQIPARHRMGEPWQGAWKQLQARP